MLINYVQLKITPKVEEVQKVESFDRKGML